MLGSLDMSGAGWLRHLCGFHQRSHQSIKFQFYHDTNHTMESNVLFLIASEAQWLAFNIVHGHMQRYCSKNIARDRCSRRKLHV